MARCRYIYDEIAGKILIPGCISVGVYNDIDRCTCKNVLTFNEYEKKRYNDEVKKLRLELKELEGENKELYEKIEKLSK